MSHWNPSRRRAAFLALVTLDLAFPVGAAELQTAHTLRLTNGELQGKASIEDMAWYAGIWRGEGLDGWNEEIWSAPHAGTMMGMYRLEKNGKTRFHELLTLTEEDGSLVLTLRHFDARLHAWEDREETVRMRFIEAREGRFYFEGITFEPHGNDSVTIYLAITNGTDRADPPHEETFTYTRSTAASE